MGSILNVLNSEDLHRVLCAYILNPPVIENPQFKITIVLNKKMISNVLMTRQFYCIGGSFEIIPTILSILFEQQNFP